jgi:hypothetical protein
MIRVQKHLISVVLFLVVALIHSSYSGFEAFAEPADPNWGELCCCELAPDKETTTCCWTEPDLYNPGETVTWCQTCDFCGDFCGPLASQPTRSEGIPPGGWVLDSGDSSSTSPPTGPIAPPQGGGVLQQPPSEGEGGILPLTRGQSVLPQDSVLQQQQQQQQPPTDQGTTEIPAITTEPATVEEESSVPVCQDGQEFNEDLY